MPTLRKSGAPSGVEPAVARAGGDAPSRTAADDAFRVARVAAPLRQSVIASLRGAIAAGRYKAGDRLTERDVCEMTGVSRTLVREAFRQLESEGLITVLPHRGPVVAKLNQAQYTKPVIDSWVARAKEVGFDGEAYVAKVRQALGKPAP